MKFNNNRFVLFVVFLSVLIACKQSEYKETTNVDSLMTAPKNTAITVEQSVSITTDSAKKNNAKIDKVLSISKGTKTYYDKIYNVSLVYPDNWTEEYNQYVAFKINSPQENERDSMKENFFYAVIEENPPTTKVIAKEPKPIFLTIDQMATKMEKEISTESTNRKNCKIVSKHKLVLNGVPAYELISTGTIKGIAMKYRIVAMKLGSRQYYLYFSSEENKFEAYQTEADMIFNSFLVK